LLLKHSCHTQRRVVVFPLCLSPPSLAAMATATIPADHEGLTPRQLRRASNVVTGLIYKGMNDFCARDLKFYNDCTTHFAALTKQYDAPKNVFPTYCAREREHLGTCRVLVSDSILTGCGPQLNALTTAIAKGEQGESVQQLTDKLYKCGMTPIPGLYDTKARKLPGRVDQGILEVAEERRKKEEFVRVVSKQAREEYAQRRGGQKQQWKPEGEQADGDKE